MQRAAGVSPLLHSEGRDVSQKLVQGWLPNPPILVPEIYHSAGFPACFAADYLSQVRFVNQNKETPASANQQKAMQRELSNRQGGRSQRLKAHLYSSY